MSYYSSDTGPRGQRFDSNGNSDHYDQSPQQWPRHMQHLGPPAQGHTGPPEHRAHDPRMRAPHQQPYHTPQLPHASYSKFNDGSDFGGPELDQWPLPARDVTHQRGGGSMQQQAGPRRGPPPRPQRPDYSPENFDFGPSEQPQVAPAYRQYYPPPPLPAQDLHHGTGEWTGDGYSVPGAQPTPDPQIHGYPVAQQAVYHQQQRRPPLGPPPSARRGPPTYYTQPASVHPIIEETASARSRASHRGASQGSFASSTAIPIGVPDYFLQNRDSTAASLPPTTPGSEYPSEDSPLEPVAPLRLESRRRGVPEHLPLQPMPPNRDAPPAEGSSLVRQASLGKRSRPTLTMVKSGDRLRKDSRPLSGEGLASLTDQQRRVTRPKDSSVISLTEPELYEQQRHAQAAAGDEAYKASNESPTTGSREPSSNRLASGTGFIDTSSSDSDSGVPTPVRKVQSEGLLVASIPDLGQSRTLDRSPLAPRDTDGERISHKKQVMGNLERGGAISAAQSDSIKLPKSGLSEARVGKPRPARLDVDRVREAEVRGSLTSLPDLIKRATRLASNLDRGKTASRLGMAGWLDESSNPELNEKVREYRKSNASLDDMTSFPVPRPGSDSAPGPKEQGSRRAWSSHLRHSMLPSDSDAGALAADSKRQRRRCWGLPLWTFILLLIVLFFLIAAAVVVPVMLVWYPKHLASQRSSTAYCAKDLTCQNGGLAVSVNDSCRCLCVNGYMGTSCGTQGQAGCTTISSGTSSTGTFQNATIGESLPRIIAASSSNYSIPLDAQALLGLFSSLDLSCSSENALATFNGSAQKRQAPTSVTENLRKRSPQATTDQPATVTSNGIIFAMEPSSSNTSSSSSSSSSSGNTSQTSLDFARTVILFLLQTTSQLSDATTAQQEMQSYFSTGTALNGDTASDSNVTLGNGFSADFVAYSIALANRTIVGGRETAG